MTRALQAGFLLLAALFLSAQRDAILVPEVSQNEVQVRQGFTGTELLLYGAILDPAGRRAGAEYDIVVVLKGPTQPIRMREKERILGIWMNAESSDFRSAPSFFAVAASRPVEEIVDERTAAIYELGTRFIQLSPSGQIDPVKQARFAAGLVEQRERKGLYKQNMKGVQITEGVLYKARIKLPSNVVTGRYTAETFAITNGRVIASAIADVEVKKVGFERFVEIAAQNWSLVYGLVAVALSIGMGFFAGRLFARL
ncbi:TIGR02186 family protein [Altererythrobacter arenosus]|uniref:TIGR02186 family protein n=1 Tax=Altererythrobacter arenosus TaxID=3032592 RepID=A0ABY8FVI2_9SPHN|nr:TIGR02186 family protein [Altererythrobacter sp. CAU 1644]WFL78095.1 TIGR02186 family protein [Altererythrobacter sp. CAU 1644]